MRRLLLPLLLLACKSSAQEPLARVEQATSEDGVAEAVFGQPNLMSGTEPLTPASNTTSSPSSIGTLAVPAISDPSPMFFVADTNANRVLGVYATSTFASILAGQNNYGLKEPNQGFAVSQVGLNGPRGVAFFAEQMAIADTGNHRVVYGYRSGSIPWYPQAVYGHRSRFDLGERNDGGTVGPETLAEPMGVAFDATFSPGRLLIADTGNHRVLIFLITTPISTTPTCIGQEDCFHGEPNRGGAVSATTFNEPTAIATWNKITEAGTDPLRGYYVVDTGNHRVLHFPIPSVTSTPDLVYGQLGDFTTATPSKGGVSASSLRNPTGVAVDIDGSLWIADTGHHRVLHFPYGKTVADRVIGQPDFTSSASPAAPSSTRLRAPGGVAVTPTEILIADTGFSRVLRYKRPCDKSKCNDGNPCTDDTCDAFGVCRNTLKTYSSECFPYQCDFMARSCSKPCDDKHICAPSFACIAGNCVIPCSSDLQCMAVGRTCIDGYCCDKPCNGPCEACNVATNPGSCTTFPEGPPPPSRRCEGSTGECSLRCNGFDGKACHLARAGSACGPESCEGNTVHKRGRCDGAGACSSMEEDCAPYACEVNACRTSCRFDFDCAAGARCNAGECVGGAGGAAAGGGCTYDPRANTIAALILAGLLAISIRRRR
jgi:hypothetical protein